MNIDTRSTKHIAVLFNLSLRHESNGRRLLDNIKTELIAFMKHYVEADDVFYLYHPYVFEPVASIGQAIGDIGNYETDGWKFDITSAFRQTVIILSDELYSDISKHIFYFTDKNQNVDFADISRLADHTLLDWHLYPFHIGTTPVSPPFISVQSSNSLKEALANATQAERHNQCTTDDA